MIIIDVTVRNANDTAVRKAVNNAIAIINKIVGFKVVPRIMISTTKNLKKLMYNINQSINNNQT